MKRFLLKEMFSPLELFLLLILATSVNASGVAIWWALPIVFIGGYLISLICDILKKYVP